MDSEWDRKKMKETRKRRHSSSSSQRRRRKRRFKENGRKIERANENGRNRGTKKKEKH